MPKNYAIADQNRDFVSVIFPNGINQRFLKRVRTVYDINDSTYSSLGLDPEKPILNEGGHVVIYYKR